MNQQLNHQVQINLPSSDSSKDLIVHRQNRLRIWEVNRCFKCPVLGMCLTIAEQKQLLKKMGALKKHLSPYEMHEIMVTAMDGDNRLSRRIDNMLERKFNKQAKALLELDSETYLSQFKDRLESGDAGVVLWATATSPTLSPECRRIVFGDIHMTMHWNGEQLMKLKRKLAQQQHETGIIQKRVEESLKRRRQLKKDFNQQKQVQEDLRKSLSCSERENQELRAMLNELNNSRMDALEIENHALEQTCDSYRKQIATLQKENFFLEEENKRFVSEGAEQVDMIRRFREETRIIIDQMSSMNHCDATCSSFDLCKKRILIVGGVTRMESLYRDLIEGSNGVFEYHDGYVKKGNKDLESRLKRADIVLCPVNCNSHAACSMVKNLGKKHNKPVHILANTSLSTVSQILWGNGGEECMLN